MIWLNPLAWIALAALAAPILIHILVQRKAERLPFPTLRFIQPTRLAAIRRHVLDDAALLAIRAAILASAVAALAGPLLVSASRREAWNARVVRAVVTDNPDGARRLQPGDSTFKTQTFATRSLPDGIRHARAWLDAAPPARREIVIVSPLALGSITLEDVAAIPAEIAIRFERAGTLAAERTIAGGHVLAAEPDPSVAQRLERDSSSASGSARAASRAEGFSRASAVRPIILQHTVALNGHATSVVEAVVPVSGSFPIDVVGDVSARPAIAAVLSQRVWATPADRHARLVLVGKTVDETAVARAGAIAQPWMADAVGRIAQDDDLQSAAAGTEVGLVDARFRTAPWITVAFASDGHPLAAAAGSPAGLVVVSAAASSDIVTPLLLRAIAGGLADPPDLRAAEVIPIPDAQLQAWTRPAVPVVVPRLDTVERDDRRWLWGLVLILLGVESWVRRSRRDEVQEAGERARVA